MEAQEKQAYKKAFNQGYRLAKEMPKFSVKTLENLPEGLRNEPRTRGMIDGMKQHSKEKYIQKTKSQTPPKPSPNKGKGIDR